MDDWISLNVGGRLFECSRGTLISDPKSALAKMFENESGLSPARTADGVFCLDADPDCFKVILTWLRRRVLVALPTSSVTASQLLAEAEYFQLLTLMEKINETYFTQKKTVYNVRNCVDGNIEDWTSISFRAKWTNLGNENSSDAARLFCIADDDYSVAYTSSLANIRKYETVLKRKKDNPYSISFGFYSEPKCPEDEYLCVYLPLPERNLSYLQWVRCEYDSASSSFPLPDKAIAFSTQNGEFVIGKCRHSDVYNFYSPTEYVGYVIKTKGLLVPQLTQDIGYEGGAHFVDKFEVLCCFDVLSAF